MAKTQEWILRRAASRIIGCDERHVEAMADQGLIGIKRLPDGIRALPRYLRSDCERVAKASVRKARTAESVK